MTDNEPDPARSTQQFRAFQQQQSQPEQVPSGGFPTGLVIGVAAVAVLVIIAVAAFMV
ncbi:hypothetical protein [Actinocorallia longicatena]|uniref:Flagellin-like protein n=1 Tax=Actinocorallia longicatena TaxID=111803 RepID=A0ABP6Q9G0_9ACTN